MNIDLPQTSTSTIVAELQRIHETTAQTTGRVLTLLVETPADDDLESIIDVIIDASREHPARVLVLINDGDSDQSGIDAQIRIGGSTGASELVIIRLHGQVAQHPDAVVTPLLLPDTPIVAWWPSRCPECPAEHPLGRIAQRRITDSRRDGRSDPLSVRAANYSAGDSDMAWARLTQWRGIVASSLDVPPCEQVESVHIAGGEPSVSVDLAAAWLADRLECPVERGVIAELAEDPGSTELSACELTMNRASGPVTIYNRLGGTVTVRVPGRPESLVAMNPRSAADCLSEELRHLDPDLGYADALSALSSVRPAH